MQEVHCYVVEMQSDIDSSREINVDDFVRLVEGLKQLHAADTDDTDTVEAFVALGGKVRQPVCCRCYHTLHASALYVAG